MRCQRTLTGVVRGSPRQWQAVGWVALLAGRLWAAMAWGQVYQVTDLGTFVPYGMNDKGSLVGVMGTHAARWLAGKSPEDLGFGGSAMGIVSSDMAAGYVSRDGYQYEAVVWNKDGTARGLGVPQGGINSRALAINTRGYACGSCVSDTLWVAGTVQTPPEMHAWRWWGVPEVLADLPGLGSCQAFGLSRHGEVVGACGMNNVLITGGGSTGQDSRAVLWDVNGTPFDLNTLALLPDGWTLVSARAINKDGDITCIAQVAGDVLPNGEPRDRGCLLERLPNAASR